MTIQRNKAGLIQAKGRLKLFPCSLEVVPAELQIEPVVYTNQTSVRSDSEGIPKRLSLLRQFGTARTS